MDEFDLPSGEDTDAEAEEELDAAASDDEEAPLPAPAVTTTAAAAAAGSTSDAEVMAVRSTTSPPPLDSAPASASAAPVATVPSRLLLGLTSKRGLGPLRADSAFYSSTACGVGLGTALSDRWVRTKGPQAVVLCDRSRDRATEEKHAHAIRLATLVAEEAARAQREAERLRRNEERQVAATALRESLTLRREAEAATAAAVRAEAKKFELRAARQRQENLAEKMRLSQIVHDDHAARAEKLSERRLAAGASSSARRMDQLRAAKIRQKIEEARKQRGEKETLLERSVQDPLPPSLVVADGAEEEKTEESSPRRRHPSAPLSPHRPPSKMHVSRAVMLDTNSPRSRSRSRQGLGLDASRPTTTASTTFPPIATAEGATPHPAAAHPPPSAPAPPKSLLWTDALPCSQAIVPRRDLKAKAARAKEEALALQALQKRAQQIRRNQARMRMGRNDVKIAASASAASRSAVKQHVIGSSSARPSERTTETVTTVDSPAAAPVASSIDDGAPASLASTAASSSPAPLPSSDLPD